MPKGNLRVNATATNHATLGKGLHFEAFDGTITNGTTLAFWDGYTNKSSTSVSIPSGSTGITPNNLEAETYENAEAVYMWQRTS